MLHRPQVTETITKVDVADRNIWSSAEYVHNLYDEGKDKAFYLCPDKINHADVRYTFYPRDQQCKAGHIHPLTMTPLGR